MAIVNLTPHPVHVYGDRTLEQGPETTYEPSGTVARLAASVQGRADYGPDGRYAFVSYGQVLGLPAPKMGVTYVVSLLTALAVAAEERHDVLAPFGEVRDGSGQIIGCRELQRVISAREATYRNESGQL